MARKKDILFRDSEEYSTVIHDITTPVENKKINKFYYLQVGRRIPPSFSLSLTNTHNLSQSEIHASQIPKKERTKITNSKQQMAKKTRTVPQIRAQVKKDKQRRARQAQETAEEMLREPPVQEEEHVGYQISRWDRGGRYRLGQNGCFG